MPTLPRTRVVLLVKKSPVPTFITFVQVVHTEMTTNASQFPAPPLTFTVFGTQIATLVTAQQATKTRASNGVAARDAARDVVWLSVESLRTYVQSRCDANPEQAIFLIKSAGMNVGAPKQVTLSVLQAKVGTQSGTAILRACKKLLIGKTSKGVTLNWQYSADSGHTWLSGGATNRARTLISGLTPLTTYLFRVSATVGDVTGAWSQAVSLIVH